MNNKRFAAIEQMLPSHDLIKDSTMSEDAIRHYAKLATLTHSMAYILADAADPFLMDSEFALGKLNQRLKRQTKKNFADMYAAVRVSRRAVKKAAGPMYLKEDFSKDACKDSDWWYNLFKLIEDRIGNNKQKTNLLLDFLLNIPSEGDGLFNVKYEDFVNDGTL